MMKLRHLGTLHCVAFLPFGTLVMNNSLAISLFTGTIAHIDFLEVKKKSISSDIRLRACLTDG